MVKSGSNELLIKDECLKLFTGNEAEQEKAFAWLLTHGDERAINQLNFLSGKYNGSVSPVVADMVTTIKEAIQVNIGNDSYGPTAQYCAVGNTASDITMAIEFLLADNVSPVQRRDAADLLMKRGNKEHLPTIMNALRKKGALCKDASKKATAVMLSILKRIEGPQHERPTVEIKSLPPQLRIAAFPFKPRNQNRPTAATLRKVC